MHAAAYSGLSAVSIDPVVANWLAFAIALPVSYFGHSRITFSGAARKSVVRFISSALLGALLNHLNVVCTIALGLSWQYGLPGMLVIVPGIMFMLNKFWVFR